MADSFAQTVKQQTDIVRIVGEYVKLRKSGANWSALCPFHKEKSGSFYLYPATASYYCFGCHEHGDVFTFVMKMDNVSFPEAVRSVATKMGIPLPHVSSRPRKRRGMPVCASSCWRFTRRQRNTFSRAFTRLKRHARENT